MTEDFIGAVSNGALVDRLGELRATIKAAEVEAAEVSAALLLDGSPLRGEHFYAVYHPASTTNNLDVALIKKEMGPNWLGAFTKEQPRAAYFVVKRRKH